jgi:restriction system protein
LVDVPAWNDYQEEVALFFRTLGLDATTNVSMKGVRTDHDVDVAVRSKHVGFDVLWIVECKLWKAAVPKEKILALRTIVDDTGADRGFVMAENGYQSGALQAARSTNITLTSLEDLRETLAFDIGTAQLHSLGARVDRCSSRYWSISKEHRIKCGLRQDVGAGGYSGQRVVQAVEYTLKWALLDGYPVAYDQLYSALSAHSGGRDRVDPSSPYAINTPGELYGVLDAEVSELERRLDDAEAGLTP